MQTKSARWCFFPNWCLTLRNSHGTELHWAGLHSQMAKSITTKGFPGWKKAPGNVRTLYSFINPLQPISAGGGWQRLTLCEASPPQLWMTQLAKWLKLISFLWSCPIVEQNELSGLIPIFCTGQLPGRSEGQLGGAAMSCAEGLSKRRFSNLLELGSFAAEFLRRS